MDSRTAVILVSFNERERLERTLGLLEKQTVAPKRTIVVDNGSQDGSPELVEQRFPSVELVRMGGNAGFAAANNAAVELARDCEYVALLNADAYPEAKWLDELVRAADADPGCASFSSRMMRANEPGDLDGGGDVYHPPGGAGRRWFGERLASVPAALEPGEVFSACAGAALYRRAAFVAAGGFDEDFFMFYEDVDLGFRLRLAGWRCRYVPDSVVAHVGSATAGLDSDFSLFHIQRNLVWTWVKDMPWPLLLLFLPAHLWFNAVATLAYVARGRGPVVLRAKLAALHGLPRELRKRRAVQRTRRAPPADVLAAMDVAGQRTLVPRALVARIAARERPGGGIPGH
jgi:GT2 family glycosyltransferase